MAGHHHLPFERQPQLFGALPLQYRAGTSVSTTKSPPTWSPEHAHNTDYPYTLTEYERDVRRWQAATEVAESRQGPLLSLAVGGAARSIADELPTELLKTGGLADLGDGRGQIMRSGVDLLLHALHRRFPSNQEATMIRAGLELLSFTPRRQETIDAVLLRFDRLLSRADDLANLQISWAFRSWILFSVLRLTAKKWSELLEKLGHRFPRNEGEYRQLEQMLQRETVLNETLTTLSHLQHNHQMPWTERNRLEGQRYWLDEGDPASWQEGDAYWSGADTYSPEGGTYYGDDNDADYEEMDSEATDEAQWNEENLLDPYGDDRLQQEQSKGLNPAYVASCYWAARRAIRRFRAASGKFQRRGARRFHKKGKGKGKGKGKYKKGKQSPFIAGAFYDENESGDYGYPAYPSGDNYGDYDTYDAYETYYKGQGKRKGKDKDKNKKGAGPLGASLACPATTDSMKKRGNCHICGQPGHWKAECPHKKSFLVSAETKGGADQADYTGHFHTVDNLPGQSGPFLSTEDAVNEEDEIILHVHPQTMST
eukprot:3039826-Amphidinium_carterae.3